MSPYIRGLLAHSLFEPVNDFTGCQGKRIRGSLLQLSYELSGGVGLLSPAISEAIESLHAGSLVIDDIQDDSQSRRGQVTLHQRIGMPLAINAGNWMYFHALECLAASPLSAEQRFRLLESMIRAARQCHEGQALDLHARVDRIPPTHWHETTLAISSMKTGALVALAVEMGCLAANPCSALRGVLPKFGRQIGIALQMRNDLDELATLAQQQQQQQQQQQPAASEPVRDDDLRNARLTWPWVWAVDLQCEERCRSLAQRTGRLGQDCQDAAAELFELASAQGNKAIRCIVRDQLRLLGEHVVDRRLLDSLGEILEPIERPLVATPTPAAALKNSPRRAATNTSHKLFSHSSVSHSSATDKSVSHRSATNQTVAAGPVTRGGVTP